MIAKKGTDFDFIFITAEYYDDHPLSPCGMIARVLDAKGYNVGIIEKPTDKEDFLKLGEPKLGFCVTSGSIDSMLNNYTSLKRPRCDDENCKFNEMPDRAVIVYCNKIKENFKNAFIIIGGIEASLRRFAHYDYWDNKVRRSILLDSRANILVYGNGEKQILEIADRLKHKKDLFGIPGTCIISKEIPSNNQSTETQSKDNSVSKNSSLPNQNFKLLPSFDEVVNDKLKFCESHKLFTNDENLAQKYAHQYVLQFKFPEYTTKDLDYYYSLPFTRKMSPASLLKMAQFSVVTHRGCIGGCNFCAIALHQGTKIISRSEENILDEIRRITQHPDFKGYIDDLGGPSANMYGMDCKTKCVKQCLTCSKLDLSHAKIISLLKKAREIPEIKKIFVRSGVRYDLAINSKEYIEELAKHHVSGCLKIAPEHFSPEVLDLMNKNVSGFKEFKAFFESVDPEQSLRYYFMIGHPGEDVNSVLELKEKIKKLNNLEQFQLFTPTPMTISSCMFWTGLNPYTGKKVKVIYDYVTKKKIKRIIQDLVERQTDY